MIRTVTQEVAKRSDPLNRCPLTGSGRLNAVVGRFPLADGAVQLNIIWHMILQILPSENVITWFSPLMV